MFTEETIEPIFIEILKQAPYSGAVLAIVASGYPNHPLQNTFFKDCLETSDKGDMATYGTI